jgi:hypothetical protein
LRITSGRTKNTVPGIEAPSVSPDGRYNVLRAIHRFDEKGTQPGGGLSVELLLDRKTHKIMQERGMQ